MLHMIFVLIFFQMYAFSENTYDGISINEFNDNKLSFRNLSIYRQYLIKHSVWMRCWYPFPNEVYNLYISKAKFVNRALAESKQHGTKIKEPVLIQSPCWFPKSLGNYLSNYVEVRLCAHVNGMHYIATSMYDLSLSNSDLFVESIPTIALHNNVAGISDSIKYIKTNCTCREYCHGGNKSLIYKSPELASSIYNGILKSYIKSAALNIHSKVNLNVSLRCIRMKSSSSKRVISFLDEIFSIMSKLLKRSVTSKPVDVNTLS